MIVDEADMRFEVPQDPFLSKGISAPWELPYTEEKKSNLKTPAAVKKIAGAFTPHARHRSFKRLRTVHRTRYIQRFLMLGTILMDTYSNS
jgi:hypothetical protein